MKACFSLFFLFLCVNLSAQDRAEHIESYSDWFVPRIYQVTKFNSIQFSSATADTNITYRPNSSFNLGTGFNYRGFGLNFSFVVPIINDDEEEFGITRHLNWDANMYMNKVALTAFFEYYKGYYRSATDGPSLLYNDESLGIRSDLVFTSIGASGVYIFNDENVSYRATFTQDEWQKESAGSFILGGFFTLTSFQGDSSILLPYEVYKNNYDLLSYFASLDIGPMAGYMHTFVIDKNFFFTFQLSGGFGYNVLDVSQNPEGEVTETHNFNFHLQERIGFGYNSQRDYIGLIYVNDNNRVVLGHGQIGYNMGQFRINYVRRFHVKRIPVVDEIMNTFHWFFMERTDAAN